MHQPPPPAEKLKYNGFQPGTYRVTVKTTVAVTKAAMQTMAREAVLIGELAVPPQP